MARFILSSICWLFTIVVVFGQYTPDEKSSTSPIYPSVVFKAHPKQHYGFDRMDHVEWKNQYPSFQINPKFTGYTAYKSVSKGSTDQVDLLFKSIRLKKKKNERIKLFIDKEPINFNVENDSTITIFLPSKSDDYTVKVYLDGQIVAKLYVEIQKEIHEKIIIVPLTPIRFSTREIEEKLDHIYRQANINFEVEIGNVFQSNVFEPSTIFSNPDPKHKEYSGQMRLLRDLYFEQHPKMDKNAYFVFLIKGFEDSLLNGFMVKNKSIAFIKNPENHNWVTNQLARTLGYGMGALPDSWENQGPEKGTTQNLMDTIHGFHLTHFQWSRLRNVSNYYSMYDNQENVPTNNGTVAYYFWEEDEHGNVIFKSNRLLKEIKKPYKQNYLSYRFKVKYWILRPFHKIGDYYISILDVLFSAGTLFILFFIRKKLKQLWEKRKWKFKFLRRFIFVSIVGFTLFQIYENYAITNKILFYFKKVSGPVIELTDLDYKQAKKELLFNNKLFHEEVSEVCSEILIHKKNKWFLKKRGRVIYFEIKKDHKGHWNNAKFMSSGNNINLSTLNYHAFAQGHYIVCSYTNEKGEIEKQKIYNYSGSDVTAKLTSEDVPNRILVFVNGYRPTSIGQTFEENFSDIQNNGLEFPNSKNFIYDFDRYDYWQPWNKVNLLFEKRINPNETYYADGHFSVETSNYRSLINFTSTSSNFPKRCKNLNHHKCYYNQGENFWESLFEDPKTINRLKLKPNKKGFALRRQKGEIAGKNLLQILNEIPGYSKNDTLYIVTHSMGFAYSQGMLKELRGKINFGGYYIIAPENAKSGFVNPLEWKEIWQYGSNFNLKNQDPPCLQDGIAPQHLVPGLASNNRICIPPSINKCKGFFDSHFIGYYTWILDIEEDQPGHIVKK